MKKSFYAIACLMMALLVGFSACSKDDDDDFTKEEIEYFNKNIEYIREKKALLNEEGKPLYQQVIVYGDTALYRVLKKEGTETKYPTSQNPIKMVLKGDLINGTNFQKEMEMTFAPAQVVPGLGAVLLQNSVGETVEAILPANLGYGYDRGYGQLCGSTLIFTYTVKSF